MWNLMTESKHWGKIVELFDVSHLRLDETLEECHPLVKSDTQINTLIGQMGKGESQSVASLFYDSYRFSCAVPDQQTSLQLLKDPTLQSPDVPGTICEPQRVYHRREGMKENLADDCIFVVLTKKTEESLMDTWG
jgi:hypothetical protein